MEGGPSYLSLQGPRLGSESHTTHTRNIILVGETGVGKSSLINLIAGTHVAPTSNDALGCTAERQRYDVSVPSGSVSDAGRSATVTLWDTAGLDEGSQGTVPATTSTVHLETLLRTLARSPSGVHLVLFCIRGTVRLTRGLAHQYDLVYAHMCRKKVPIALVVTGLEHLYLERSEGMDSWWMEHEGEVKRLGMTFHTHACVTTMETTEDIVRERQLASQKRLRELVVECTGPRMVPWKIGPSWQSVVVSELCRMLRIRSLSVHRFYVALRHWFAGVLARFITDTNQSVRLAGSDR